MSIDDGTSEGETSSADEGPSESGKTRRGLLRAVGAASAAGALSTLFAEGAIAETVTPETPTGAQKDVFDVRREEVRSAYPQSVASGDPTPSGVVVWTRLDPSVYEANRPVGVEVATDEAFDDVTYRGIVPSNTVGPAHDYTVNVDLDGSLKSDRHYFYRFVYGGDASPVGRLRTLPEPTASPEEASFAVLSCNNYLHGYYGALGHVADEDVDFVVHLGDFIYEYAGDGHHADRAIRLPSGHDVAWGLEDFRHLHRNYRGDEFMQRALERHTLVHTWDDHEIVNNRWWNYEEGAPETESHPNGDDPEFMKRLYVEGIKALTEYVPSRVKYEPGDDGELDGNAIHDQFRLYRSFEFGDLADLFVTDERLYRSPPPKDAFGRRDTGVPPTETAEDPDRTMLGREQRRWLVDGLTGSDATWKLWGNEVLNAALKYTNADDASFYLNYDAWDGYRFERQYLMGELRRADVENFVTLTGDMHTYVASYLLENYETTRETGHLPAEDERVGVEFMTPAVSSDNLAAATKLPPDQTEEAVNLAVKSQNPHIEWFNSSRWGYAVVRVTRDECRYTAYSVDRTVDSADAPKRLLRSYRVPAGRVELEERRKNALDGLVGSVDGYGVGKTTATDGPDVYGNPDAAGGDDL